MTFEELKAYQDDILKNNFKNYIELWRPVIIRYAEESDDELLKKAVHETYVGGERTPWGDSKVLEFVIGSDKVQVNHEAKTITGPEHIVNEIKEANERWSGVRDPKRNSGSYADTHMYVAPGNLWNFYALVPLVYRIYEGKKEVKWSTLEHYPKNPLDELKRKLGWTVDICY